MNTINHTIGGDTHMRHLPPDGTMEFVTPAQKEGPDKKIPSFHCRLRGGDLSSFVCELIRNREMGEGMHGTVTPPQEVVDRAIEIAELTFDRLIERGHAISSERERIEIFR
jgi:hypothetical protein